MKRIGIIADSHLPETAETVKEKVFDWALSAAKQKQLDCIIGAGDLTSCGSYAAAERIWKKLDSTGIPFVLTPGNADLRDSATRSRTLPLLKSCRELPGIFLVDSAKREVSAADLARLRTIIISPYKFTRHGFAV